MPTVPSRDRAHLAPFDAIAGGTPLRDQRDLMERPFFSLAKTKRTTPILYKTGETEVQVFAAFEHGMATIWDADILIWAASQILAAQDRGLPTSRWIRFRPYKLLTAISRGAGARNYRLLKGAVARLQSTVIRTTIRQGPDWRRQQFSWVDEWEERISRRGDAEGMEIVLPDWFYQGVCDRRRVLAIDPNYFHLSGGIERWLYRVARKHAGRQPQGWRFELRHLHLKSASQARFSDFALDIRAIVRRQPLPGYRLALERAARGGEVIVMSPTPIVRTMPAPIVDKLWKVPHVIDTSGAPDIGISGADRSVLRAHDDQTSLWPDAEIAALKDSKSESKLLAVEPPPRCEDLGSEPFAAHEPTGDAP